MAGNPHFVRVEDWRDANRLVDFQPVELAGAEGFDLESLSVHVRDHKLRELEMIDRTLEAYYGGFSFSQRRRNDEHEARRLALDVSYGADSRVRFIGDAEAQICELGPEVDPDDVDGRVPAVVAWSVEDMFYLVASYQLPANALVRIAESLG